MKIGLRHIFSAAAIVGAGHYGLHWLAETGIDPVDSLEVGVSDLPPINRIIQNESLFS